MGSIFFTFCIFIFTFHHVLTLTISCQPACSPGLVCVVTQRLSNTTACVSDPCSAEVQRCNGRGVCTATVLDEGITYRCECGAGYSGKDCESFSSTNGCFRSPCQFSGICVPVNDEDYTCVCDGTGHFGRHCEVEDLCATNPCVNGVCELVSSGNTLVVSRRCRCRPGFTGVNCETDINECDYKPCNNGMECENLAGSYRCHCSAQFTGVNCSVPITSMCSPGTCLNRGTCKPTQSGPVCQCSPGWAGDFCQLDVDECRTRTCQNGGTCLDHSNGTSCLCLPGWNGPNCELDINECSLPGSRDLCKHNGDCKNVNGSYYCVCPIGYAGRDCSTILNMCDKKANLSCLNGGVCKSEIGYYRCECPTEWQGTYCELRNPCARNPCKNSGKCIQLFDDPESYRCYCLPGFTGQNCETDVDECQMNPCDTSVGATCQNTVGSFICHCPPGLTGQFCSETAIYNCSAYQPCSNGGTCVSKIGGYACICPPGFTSKSCETNIDECAKNPCQNSGTCIDGIASFKCLCAASFTGRRCETVIDLCASDRDYCYHGGRCSTFTDKLGNARAKCQCLSGFIGDRCEGNVNECASNPCNAVGTSSCQDLIDDYSCLCRSGYTGRRCETKIGDPSYVTPETNANRIAVAAECSESCNSRAGDNHCNVECNNAACSFDGGDCVPSGFGTVVDCPAECGAVFANDRCDRKCNIKPCLWDGNDCLPQPVEKSRYIDGIVAVYRMSCADFHSGASSLLLFNLSSTVGAVVREDPATLMQNEPGFQCNVSLMFDKVRCAKEVCPKTAKEFVDSVSTPEGGELEYLVNTKPDQNDGGGSGPSTNQIIIASIVSSGALIASVLIIACVLGKRVRTKTWFPPGFFDVLRLADQNTSHLPPKQRKTSTASSSATTTTSPASAVTSAAIFGGGPSTQYVTSDAFSGVMLNTPPDRREIDLVDPTGPDGLTPLMLTCTSAHLSNPPQRVADMVYQLLSHGANPQSKTVQREETALHLAARYRNTVALRILLDFCQDPNVRDAEGKTPLHSAVGADAQDCMRWLLRHRMIHVDARMNDGTTPLILATRLCLNPLVTDLVRCNAKLDTQDAIGRTALHWAAAVDNVEAVHLLARHGADKDAQDSREQTPLFLACREGNASSVVALLEIGAQRDLADHADVTPRQAAVEAGNRDVVRMLDEFVPDFSGTPSTSNAAFMVAAAAVASAQHQQHVAAAASVMNRPSTSAASGPVAAASVKTEAMYHGEYGGAVLSDTSKGQKLYVDLPPPYSEKPSMPASMTPVTPQLTAGTSSSADSSSQWPSTSSWQQQQQHPQQSAPVSTSSSISPHHQPQNNRLTENFLTPSPDNHSSHSATSPPSTSLNMGSLKQQQQPVVSSSTSGVPGGSDSINSSAAFFSVGVASYMPQPQPQPQQHRQSSRRHNQHQHNNNSNHHHQSLLTAAVPPNIHVQQQQQQHFHGGYTIDQQQQHYVPQAYSQYPSTQYVGGEFGVSVFTPDQQQQQQQAMTAQFSTPYYPQHIQMQQLQQQHDFSLATATSQGQGHQTMFLPATSQAPSSTQLNQNSEPVYF